MPTIGQLEDNLRDIQGNVIRGYRPACAAYLFYDITNEAGGKQWLKALLDDARGFGVTSAAWKQANGKTVKPLSTLNIALSSRGLCALGVPDPVLKSFPEEFRQGMHARAVEILGDEPDDVDKARPKHWEEGFASGRIAALVVITLRTAEKDVTDETIDDLKKALQSRIQALVALERTCRGVKELVGIRQIGARLATPTEHFGYADGISQPFIQGTEELYKDVPEAVRPPFPGQGTPAVRETWKRMNADEFVTTTTAAWKHIKPGEFILGYEDEFGEVAQSPMHYGLRKNGTFLVFRKLEQNVPAFRAFLTEKSRQVWEQAPSRTPEDYENWLAAKLMGRWRSGCPLTLSDQKDDPDRDYRHPKENNDFLYGNDPDGLKCPVGAHIRRTNPRDYLHAAPENFLESDKNLYHLNRHRIIRRGLTYGTPYRGQREDDGCRGVLFMALNASIGRQFEFLQQQWVNNGGFLGLDKTDRDPILGKKDDGNAQFTVPGADHPFIFNLQRFVTERGGEYFFYPGLGALRGLAEGTFTERSSFLSDYEALQSISNPVRGAIAKQRLAQHWLIRRAKEMFDELREKRPIFEVPPIPALGPIPGKPGWIIATKYEDVRQILRNEENAFSVTLYTAKMAPPRGPFILGMEHTKEQYKKELEILRRAVPSADLETMLRPLIERLAGDIMKKPEHKRGIDVIEGLVWPVAIGVVKEYFGVPGPDDDTLKRWCRDIYTDLFLNLREDENWTRLANLAVDALNAHLDTLIESKRHELKSCKKYPPETVLTRLIAMQEGADERFHFEDKFVGVRRNIFGMVIGVVETTLKAVPRTIDQLLDLDERFPRQQILKKARRAARDRKDKKLSELSKYVWEAMRFNPQNHVIFRMCTKATTLAKNTDRETVVPPGTLVFAGTLGAMFDSDVIGDPYPGPEVFHPGRPDHHYLFFGYGPHECLGKYISQIQVPVLIKHVVTREELKRRHQKKGGDGFDRVDLLPEHFFLEFKPH